MNKIDSWYNRFLSQARKEIMLKAVISALPTYTISCFMLPKVIIKEITMVMRRFWWSLMNDRYRIHWIGWKKITASKRDGGLGIRDMEHFNKALLAKQGWRILKNLTSLLARVLKAKYFRNCDFLNAQCYSSSTYAWKSIVQPQDLIERGNKWIVGDGEHIDVWKDNWIHSQQPSPAQGRGSETHPHIRVKDLFHPGTKE